MRMRSSPRLSILPTRGRRPRPRRPRRRAGEDQIAGQQFVVLRQEMQHVRHVPDHVGQIALLPGRAVDLEDDAAALRMSDLGDAVNRADRRRLRERFADVPRTLDFPHRVLQIAPRHVESDRVAVDQLLGALRRDAGAASADRDDQLDFVMVVLGRPRVLHVGDRGRHHRDDRIGRLGEKERRLLRRVSAHFLGVLGIVATHAIDMANRKGKIGAGDRHRRDVPGGDRVFHRRLPCG